MPRPTPRCGRWWVSSRRPTPPWPYEAEKPAEIRIVEVGAFGSLGRVYLGGEERDIDVGWRAARASIEAIEGRVEES